MELNEAMETIQVQKSYISSMTRQLELMEHSIREHTIARETLAGIEGKGTGSEMLVPVGGGTKTFATLQDVSRVIVDIGSGVEMEMTIKDAKEHHETIVKKLTEEMTGLQEKLREMQSSTATLSNAVEKAYMERMQQGQMPGGGQKNLMS